MMVPWQSHALRWGVAALIALEAGSAAHGLIHWGTPVHRTADAHSVRATLADARTRLASPPAPDRVRDVQVPALARVARPARAHRVATAPSAVTVAGVATPAATAAPTPRPAATAAPVALPAPVITAAPVTHAPAPPPKPAPTPAPTFDSSG